MSTKSPQSLHQVGNASGYAGCSSSTEVGCLSYFQGDLNDLPVLPETVDAAVTQDCRRRKTRSSGIKGYEDESSFGEDDVDLVIRNLKTAKHSIQARVDFANEVHEAAHPEGLRAYAKIAGRGWTFYVDQLEVRIGRPAEERPSGSQSTTAADQSELDTSLVHIDLGPSKLISRLHAEIHYDAKTGHWNIMVNGRNGIKINEAPLGRGETGILVSGSVIDVSGTQMMFVTPSATPPLIHPLILAQARQVREENEDDEDGELEGVQPLPPPQQTPKDLPSTRSAAQHRPSSSQYQVFSQPYQKRHAPTSSLSGLMQPPELGTDAVSQTDYANSKISPTYARGLMLETTEDIDYSQDSAKDLKPPYSYAQLIGMAILSSPEEKLTLSKIYDFIKERYAFYRLSGGGWQVSMPFCWRYLKHANECYRIQSDTICLSTNVSKRLPVEPTSRVRA